jgi:hypothetical protein
MDFTINERQLAKAPGKPEEEILPRMRRIRRKSKEIRAIRVNPWLNILHSLFPGVLATWRSFHSEE